MKTILRRARAGSRQISKTNLLAVPLLIGFGTVANVTQAAGPGSVVVWGDGTDGETDVPLAAQSGVTAIAAGYTHVVALKTDGTVVAWGRVEDGLGGLVPASVPAGLSGVTAIAANTGRTVVLKADGSVVAWGINWAGDSDLPVEAKSGVVAIAAGGYHDVALKGDGSVIAWGTLLFGLTTVPEKAQGEVTAIAAGYDFTVVLKADGSVVRWGKLNYFGDTTELLAGPQSRITAIAAGSGHVLGLKADGSVVAWGDDRAGQATVPLEALSGVTAIAAGVNSSVALKHDGSVVAWGKVWDGSQFVPESVPVGLSDVTAIAAGRSHTLALVSAAVLQARPGDSGLVLSWPTNQVGFTLQSAPKLTSPEAWVDSITAPAVVGDRYAVTNSVVGGTQFFRLHK